MKRVVVLATLFIFVVSILPAISGIRIGGMHTKRSRALKKVTCYVDGKLIKMTLQECEFQDGRVLSRSEIAELKRKSERQEVR
jgi:hypothetical protein